MDAPQVLLDAQESLTASETPSTRFVKQGLSSTRRQGLSGTPPTMTAGISSKASSISLSEGASQKMEMF